MEFYEINFRSKDELMLFRQAFKSHVRHPNISVRYEDGEKNRVFIVAFNREADKKLKEAFGLVPALTTWKSGLYQDNCQCGNGKNCCKVIGISNGRCTCSES